jgi:hypothetical protein
MCNLCVICWLSLLPELQEKSQRCVHEAFHPHQSVVHIWVVDYFVSPCLGVLTALLSMTNIYQVKADFIYLHLVYFLGVA